MRLKQQRQTTPHHLKWEDYPVAEKFERLSPSRKRLMDTVRMDLMRSEADLSPDLAAGTLTIRVHPMANPRNNRAIEHLLTELNNTESNYPGTTLKLVYHLVGIAPKP